MKKKHFLFVTLIVSVVSCTNVSDDMLSEELPSQNGIVILKERDPNFPWIPSNHKSMLDVSTRNTVRNYPGLSHRSFLGCSFKDDVYPLEDTRNLGYQVVDIDKLYKDNTAYLDAWKNNTGQAGCFSYATFDRYVSNSTITNTISGGTRLNLGLFSIGNKSSLSTVFSKSIVEDKNTTFGELNIVVRDSCYRMQYSSSIQTKIKEKYLSEIFKDELYNTHPSEFFSNYGGFVLTNFVVGGKATAWYAGTYKRTETNETKETKMSNEIDASYGFKFDGDKGGSASGNLALGRSNNSGTSVTNEFSSIKMSIKTIGGNSSFASFSIPKEVKNTNVDLSAWVTSLNDKSTHSIVEFGNSGLIPITDFLVEENLKNQINKYYETGVSQIEKLQEPYISIEMTGGLGGQFYVFGTILNTRFGDGVVLRNKAIPIGRDLAEKVLLHFHQETERISKMFGLKILNNTSYKNASNSEYRKTMDANFILSDVYNEIYLKKVVCNGTVYIISSYESGNNKKYALSIHKDNYIDEYVMRDLVNRLPIVNMTYKDIIENYIIYAL